MKIETHRPHPVRSWLLPNMRIMCVGIFVFVVTVLFSRMFDRQQSQLFLMSSHGNAAELSEQLSEAVENEVNKRLVAVQALAAFKKTNDTFTQQEFLDFASEIEIGEEGILSLQFAPDGIVRYLTKPEQNSEAFGHNLLEDPNRSGPALASIESEEFIIVGPVELKQGGRALIAHKPLYDRVKWHEKEFWGFATVVLDFTTLTNLFPEQNQQGQYQYALRRVENGTTRGEVFWGDPAVFESEPHLTVVQLAAGNWELATIPVDGWPSAWPFATHFRLATICIASILAVLCVVLLRKPRQLRRAIKVATSELRRTEQQLRSAHRIAKVGAWNLASIDKIACSPEALLLLNSDSNEPLITFTDLYERIHSDDKARVKAEVTTAITNFSVLESTFRINKSEETISVIRMNGEADFSAGESERTYFGTLQDITVQTSNEERLKHAQKMEAIGQLTGGIAHDFNNLLSVILGNAELLELTLDHDRDLLTEIQRASHRGAALTHRLLAYARKQPLSPTPTNLNVLIENMNRLLSRTIGEHIEVKLEFQDDLWWVKVDSGQIEDAILNLAINSRDAMPTGGAVIIKCENVVSNTRNAPHAVDLAPGRYVAISVTDTGFGMSDHVKKRAIEPFFHHQRSWQGIGFGALHDLRSSAAIWRWNVH